jgi:glycosyltransferase involved in cell wall biosynthesis
MTNSIVIPVHNESENLEAFLVEFFTKMDKEDFDSLKEVLLVENGSTDNTYEVCQNLQKKYPNKVKAIKMNVPSYGESIKHGMMVAKGDVVTILECDFLLVDFNKEGRKLVKEGVDFVVASKRHKDSVDGRPFKRRMLTFLFNLYLKLFLQFPGTDTHGLKAINAKVARELCKKAITTDEVFQTEIVLLAYKLGHKVIEVPVRIEERRSTAVKIHKRLPKVMTIIDELKKSLKRF